MATIMEMARKVEEQVQLAQLSPEGEALAVARLAEFLEWLDDLRWEQTFNSPEGQAIAQRLMEEAMAEEARGEVEDGGFDGL
jgi:hypothetical protein